MKRIEKEHYHSEHEGPSCIKDRMTLAHISIRGMTLEPPPCRLLYSLGPPTYLSMTGWQVACRD